MTTADRVLQFASLLTITSGRLAGSPMQVLPHIETAIRGALQPGVRTACISWPRKQSKTTGFCGVLALAATIGPLAVPRGQSLVVARSRDQASFLFDEVCAFIQAEPELARLVNISASRKTITSLTNGSTFRAAASDHSRLHGAGADLFVLDEAAQQRDSNLWDVLKTSQSARARPLAICIGTRSQDETHFFSELMRYGEAVNRGEIVDPSFYCHVLSADPALPWDDPETWKAVNPCLAAGVQDIGSLQELADQAKRIPSKRAVFESLHLNRAVDAEGRFIPIADWDACQGKAELTGPIYAGLDLGSTQSITSLALYAPETGAVKVFNWLPDEPPLRDRADKERVPYPAWQEQGWIETTPGPSTDREYITGRLIEICNRYSVAVLAVDRWRMEDIQTALQRRGVELPIEGFGQGYASMSPALDRLEELALSHYLKCENDPVLTWAFSNVKLKQDDAGNRKATKARTRGRIDPFIALTMAVGVAARHMPKPAPDFENSLLLV